MREVTDGDVSLDRSREGEAPTVFETDRAEALRESEERVVATVGDPAALERHWRHQDGPGDCAIYAEGTALEAFGKEFDPEHQRAAGEQEGTYSRKDGTDVAALGHVWQREGISVERYRQTIADDGDRVPSADDAFAHLSDALEGRRGVVAAVDSGPLWHDESTALANRGHAVWVTGLEERDSGSVYVVCNDSGVPDGDGKRYPIEDFERAWRRTGYDMVITRDSFKKEEMAE